MREMPKDIKHISVQDRQKYPDISKNDYFKVKKEVDAPESYKAHNA